MTRFDHDRPEPADVQARIQLAAAAKRERKRRVRVRAAELTALGREVSRAWVQHPHVHLVKITPVPGDFMRLTYEPCDEVRAACLALAARRAQP